LCISFGLRGAAHTQHPIWLTVPESIGEYKRAEFPDAGIHQQVARYERSRNRVDVFVYPVPVDSGVPVSLRTQAESYRAALYSRHDRVQFGGLLERETGVQGSTIKSVLALAVTVDNGNMLEAYAFFYDVGDTRLELRISGLGLSNTILDLSDQILRAMVHLQAKKRQEK